ncbi:hypothetical protein HNR17_002387 [Galbitalea soli]|nr:hypothetical protein [Galbitalea soli]
MTDFDSRQFARSSAKVLAWCHVYTRGLPAAVASTRLEEMLSEVYEHEVDAQRAGLDSKRAARALLVRAVRGAWADVLWRLMQQRQSGSYRQLIRLAGNGLNLGMFCLAVIVISGGSLAVARNLTLSDITSAHTPAPSVAVVTAAVAASMCAAIMFARRRSRLVGAIWLTVSSQVVLFQGLQLMARTTTVLLSAEQNLHIWSVCLALTSGGVGLFCLAYTLWSSPLTKEDK